jgi:GAF domain-containing protein
MVMTPRKKVKRAKPGGRSSGRVASIRRSSGRLKTVSPPESQDLFAALHPDDSDAAQELASLRHEVANLKRLQEVIHFLGGAPDLQTLRTELLDLALSIMGMPRGMLALAAPSDDDSRRYRVRAKRGYADEDKGGKESQVLMGMLNRALREKEIFIVGDIKGDGILGHAVAGRRVRLGAVACLPLINNGELLGALLLDDPTKRTFSASDQDLLRSFARHASVALARVAEQSRVRRQAAKLQRRSERLEAQLDQSSRRAKRQRQRMLETQSELDAVRRDRQSSQEFRGLLDSTYEEAKLGFTERYLEEVMSACGGDLRRAAYSTGLPLARLIGLLDHLGIGGGPRPWGSAVQRSLT